MMAGFLFGDTMNMTIEVYEQAVHRAIKELAVTLQRPIKPSFEKPPVGGPILIRS